METVSKATATKKKKSRFFETYVPKVLKQVSDKSGITLNAKQQLNSALCLIAEEVAKRAGELTMIAKKKTLFEKEIFNALRIVLPSGEMVDNAINDGTKTIHKLNDTKGNDGSSRQTKAGIIFPPSVAEKFLRRFGYTNLMINKQAPFCFAAALENVAAEILELSAAVAQRNKRKRITIRDMELGVRGDHELDRLFRKLGICFLGGGSVPFVHQSLTAKKTRRRRAKSATDTVRKHRFRPGTVSLREIKKMQRMFDCLTLAKSPFEKIVRSIIKENDEDHTKISKDVFVVLQYFIEQYLVDMLRDSNFVAIHAGRVKLIPLDIELAVAIKSNSTNPYENEEVDEEVDEDHDVEEIDDTEDHDVEEIDDTEILGPEDNDVEA